MNASSASLNEFFDEQAHAHQEGRCARSSRACQDTLKDWSSRHSFALTSCATFAGCWSLVALALATGLPMFIATSYVDETKDMAMADGLFVRDACFGHSRPDEETLRRYGFTCHARRQTFGCEDTGLSQEQRRHCTDYEAAPALQLVGVVACALATAAAPSATHALRPHLTALLGVTIVCASATLAIVLCSDMYTSRETSRKCHAVANDAWMCTTFGASAYLQVFGLGAAVCACLSNAFLAARDPNSPQAQERVPLLPPLQHPQTAENVTNKRDTYILTIFALEVVVYASLLAGALTVKLAPGCVYPPIISDALSSSVPLTIGFMTGAALLWVERSAYEFVAPASEDKRVRGPIRAALLLTRFGLIQLQMFFLFMLGVINNVQTKEAHNSSAGTVFICHAALEVVCIVLRLPKTWEWRSVATLALVGEALLLASVFFVGACFAVEAFGCSTEEGSVSVSEYLLFANIVLVPAFRVWD